jgi:copper chaperone CopZ
MTPTTDAFDDASNGSTATTGTSETPSTQTFQVVGMTCDHCARAVTSELMAIGGVTEVSVDVPTGQITVGSAQPLANAELRAAIDEAGYQLA